MAFKAHSIQWPLVTSGCEKQFIQVTVLSWKDCSKPNKISQVNGDNASKSLVISSQSLPNHFSTMIWLQTWQPHLPCIQPSIISPKWLGLATVPDHGSGFQRRTSLDSCPRGSSGIGCELNKHLHISDIKLKSISMKRQFTKPALCITMLFTRDDVNGMTQNVYCINWGRWW